MAASATAGVLWLTALAFGLPGGRVAGATQSSDGTLRAARVGSPAGSRALVPAPALPNTSGTPSPAASSPDLPTASAPASATPSAPAGAATTTTPAGGSTPPHGIPVAQRVDPGRVSGQSACPDVSTRQVMTVAPGNAGRLTVALTFDDGPGEDTDAVLKVLAREHVHATFFVIGHEVAAHPGLVRRESQEGHLIGNHTYDHVYPRDLSGGWSSRYLTGQLRSTADLVRKETGLPTCFFRPPGGFMPHTVLPTTRKLRMSTALWTVDTRDWAVQGPTPPAHASVEKQARVIAGRAVGAGSPGPHPIVLFHDGGGFRGSTAASVDRVIRWYKARGYVFVRLDGKV